MTSIVFFQQIGAEIGRGAFAVVYQAFNVETGDFVAVKRFPLTAIDDDSLGSIQVSYATFQLIVFLSPFDFRNHVLGRKYACSKLVTNHLYSFRNVE